MSITRRKFLKAAAAGGAFATASRIYFPKPATSYSLNYVLSVDGKAEKVFNTLTQANVARNQAIALAPETPGAVENAVSDLQAEFTARAFNDAQTAFAQRRDSVINPIWGRQRNEPLGPNPGFGTTQIEDNYVKEISFTGSTTAGIDWSTQILSGNEHLNGIEIDNALIPVAELYDDWGTWYGDINPDTGEHLGSSRASYRTRWGRVRRIYEVIEPGPGGFGVIYFSIDSGGRLDVQNLEIKVEFV